LKFFLYDATTLRRLNVESEQSTMREVFLNESKAKADAEWKEVYPEYQDYVRTIKLNNIWVLQMPYFCPILPTERQSALAHIEPVLDGFTKNDYKYKDADLNLCSTALQRMTTNTKILICVGDTLTAMPTGSVICLIWGRS
jgi:hypothetical protein